MQPMRILISVTVLALAGICRAAEGGPGVVYPDQVFRCLMHPIASGLDVVTDYPPYYLRGDFDGDGRADYAVAVRGKRTKRLGVLICDAKGRAFLLGADNPTEPPFSDIQDDRFFGINWVVYSRAEMADLGKLSCCAPYPYPLPKAVGETIGMIWENGTGLIYWDGSRYRWAGFK